MTGCLTLQISANWDWVRDRGKLEMHEQCYRYVFSLNIFPELSGEIHVMEKGVLFVKPVFFLPHIVKALLCFAILQ